MIIFHEPFFQKENMDDQDHQQINKNHHHGKENINVTDEES
jgi:hypothetical protein